MKKHFIFLGAAGIIYYSWLLIILFIAFILAYEGNKTVSIPGIAVGSVFALFSVYTWFFSYLSIEKNFFTLKLPYRTKLGVQKPELLYQWHFFKIYKLKTQFQSYSILLISRKKN